MSRGIINAFVTNLGMYVEGRLVGEYLTFPTTEEAARSILRKIGIDGKRYQEIFITDYESDIEGLCEKLSEYESIDELNYLASLIDELDPEDSNKLEDVIEFGDYTSSVQDLINLVQNLDCYELYAGVNDEEELGYYLIDECGAPEVPDHLKYYIDYEAYGRDVSMENGGVFTGHGYVTVAHGSFKEYYGGVDIPDEYRIFRSMDEVAQ